MADLIKRPPSFDQTPSFDRPPWITQLIDVLGVDGVSHSDDIRAHYAVDETLKATPIMPAAVAFPSTTSDVVAIVQVAVECGVPVTARGAGTGLSGACIPRPNGLVVSFERMTALIEIDDSGHT